MSLQPLPVPTRVYHGEGVISYSQRHAARNHSNIADIERGVRQLGVRLPKTRVSPERFEVWQQLGSLHQTTFSTPASIAGSVVSDRQLCLRCTQGNRAMGRIPGVGMVCLRHKHWLGSPQIGLDGYFPALTAERHFRNHLARRGILFDSFATGRPERLCQGLEDAAILAALLDQNTDLPTAFARFAAFRQPRIKPLVRESAFIGRVVNLRPALLSAAASRATVLIPEALLTAHLATVASRSAFALPDRQ